MSEENFDEMEKTAEEEKENKEIDEEEEKRKEQEKKALEKKRIRKRNRRIKNVMIAIGSILTYQFIVNRIENYKESLKDIAQYANNEKLISELNNETYRNIYNLTPEDVMQLESLGEQISEYRRLKEIEKRTANEDLQLGYVNKVVPIDKSSIILTIVLAFIFLKEDMTLLKWMCVILIGAGTYLMIDQKESSTTTHHKSWLIYALISAVFASLTSLLGKVGMQNIDSNLGTAIRTVVVLIMSWVVVFVVGKQHTIKEIDRHELLFICLFFQNIKRYKFYL